jgi:hypothetical protein
MTLTAGVMVRGLNLMSQILRMLMQWQQFKSRCLKIVMNSVSEHCLDLHTMFQLCSSLLTSESIFIQIQVFRALVGT